MWVPHTGRVLQDGSHDGLVGGLLDVARSYLEIPSQEAKHPVPFGADVVDVRLPSDVALDGDPKVLRRGDRRQCVSMEDIVVVFIIARSGER